MSVQDEKDHYSQLIVVVTIVGVDDDSQVFYTYTDNVTSQLKVEDRISHVRAVIPYHTVYALDYASSRNGWRFGPEVTPCHESPPTVSERTDNKMCMITTHKDHVPHHFEFHFWNKRTGGKFKDDPQEANIKQP